MYDAVCVLSSAVRNRCVGVCTCSERFSLTGLGLAPASGFWLWFLASVSTPIATPVQLLFLFLSWFLYRLQSCQTQVQALCSRSRSGSCMFRALPSSTPALGSIPVPVPVPCSCSLFPVPCSLFPVPCSLFPVPCSVLVKLQLPAGSSFGFSPSPSPSPP